MSDPLRDHYQNAAYSIVVSHPRAIQSLSPMEVVTMAADAAVETDRRRMAEQLRSRVIHSGAKIPDATLGMLVQEAFFDLAAQIEQGMPYVEASDGAG